MHTSPSWARTAALSAATLIATLAFAFGERAAIAALVVLMAVTAATRTRRAGANPCTDACAQQPAPPRPHTVTLGSVGRAQPVQNLAPAP